MAASPSLFRKLKNIVTKTLNSADQLLLSTSAPSQADLQAALERINSEQQELINIYQNLASTLEDTTQFDEEQRHIEYACAKIRSKILAITQGAIPKTIVSGPSVARSTSSFASRSSQISVASSTSRGKIAALKQQLADEEARKKREQEMEHMRQVKADMLKRAAEAERKRRLHAEEEERRRKQKLEDEQKRAEEELREAEEEMERQLKEKQAEYERFQLESQLRAEIAREKAISESLRGMDLEQDLSDQENELGENEPPTLSLQMPSLFVTEPQRRLEECHAPTPPITPVAFHQIPTLHHFFELLSTTTPRP